MSKQDKYDTGPSIIEEYYKLKEENIALKQEIEECNTYIATLLQIILER